MRWHLNSSSFSFLKTCFFIKFFFFYSNTVYFIDFFWKICINGISFERIYINGIIIIYLQMEDKEDEKKRKMKKRPLSLK